MNVELFIKDFTGTTKPRVLKFDTNIGYDKLYCVLDKRLTAGSVLENTFVGTFAAWKATMLK